MYHIIGETFFVPLASPNKTVYWECICKLFSVMNEQLSFGVERDVLVDELQFLVITNGHRNGLDRIQKLFVWRL